MAKIILETRNKELSDIQKVGLKNFCEMYRFNIEG
jgi:hypothetical protein